MFRTAKYSHDLTLVSRARLAWSVVGSSAYTLMRVIVGSIMVAHGAQKLLNLVAFEQQVAHLGIPLPEIASKLSVGAEFLGGLALVFGLVTPLAAFAILANMIVAVVTVHLRNGLFAESGGFEYPLTLASAALVFMFNGGGPLSLDAALAQSAPKDDDRLPATAPQLAAQHRHVHPSGELPSDADVDPVTRAGMESFPASDPPAHSRSN